ncbi:hypothetical protein LAZ67_21001652 [Cordylochernes scorpioides]|uniref:RNA-directed DNA polymerase n=1 Tax=Cordylochernes scorpioides TaxID=51811 RepID=A0ABY6LN65_9ARAC|nr:hypothetical protein LAZ67_21001652 [Cordylochernes scorpioides]
MENSVQVPKFDGKNFASWKFRIVSILEGKELDDLLEGDTPEDEVKFKEWKKKDAQAKGISTCAMTDSLVALILNCKTSKDIWIALHERYEGEKKKNIIEARNYVSRLTMKKEENWEEYLYRAETLLEQARNLGAEIEDQEFTTSVIRGLPQKYNLVALQLNCQMKNMDTCQVCIQAKHPRTPFKPVLYPQSTRPLDLIHIDLIGPIQEESIGGAKYVLTLVDDFSRKIFVEFLSSKLETFDIIRSFIEEIEKEKEIKVKQLRSDNGKEFTNHQMTQYLKEETIPENSEEVENHDDHSHSDLENQDEHSELPYNLRPNLKDKLYYELSSDDEPIEDNEDKDPTYDPAVGALKLSHGNLLASSYEKAINHPDSPLWQQAMDKEIHSLQNHHVWDLTELPEGAKTIKSKWIFSKKMDPQTNQEIYKARLVALGCSQEYGTDYTETFSPVMKTDSFRTLLAYATMAGYEFHHFDIETAFLYGKLSETIYMTQPPGYQDDKKNTSSVLEFPGSLRSTTADRHLHSGRLRFRSARGHVHSSRPLSRSARGSQLIDMPLIHEALATYKCCITFDIESQIQFQFCLLKTSNMHIVVTEKTKSATEALRAFRSFKDIRSGKGPMSCYSLRRMIKSFEETGSLEAKPRSGRPSTCKSVAVTVLQNAEAIETLSTYEEELYQVKEASSPMEQLLAKMEDLEKQVSELRLERSRSRYENRTYSRPRSNSRKRFNPDAEEDKPKTAITTPFGLFEFNVMSFGLRNAPSTFQRCIHQTLQNLDFTFPYLDDILIASESEEEHQNHLKIVFERFSKYGLRINMEKSVFGVKEIEFLGYLITPEGFSPLPERVEVIQEYKLPTTIQELRAFLSMLNFYRPFLKDAAETQSILHDYLKGSKKKDKRLINWTEEAKEIFNKCKNDLAKATLLSYPNSELPLSLCTDASNWAIGAVLQQYENEAWKPIAFFSKKLNESQKNYSTYDRELLSIYMSIKHFKYMLEGRTFKIFTDHKPLVFAFKQRNDKASPRQVRQLQYISQFSTDIIYIKGEQNIVADNLSRIEDITKIIDYDEIAKEQDKDKELIELINSNKSLKFKRYPLPSGKSLWCDTSTENIRPFVPKQFRMKIFQQIHGLSHPGIKTSVKDMTSRFIWPDIKRNIKEWAQTCIQCQRNKTSRHTKSEIKQFKEPDERFSTVHIDLIGPFPPSNVYVYCLTCIDRFTGWIEAIPIRNETAETVARAFYEGWITRFGVPYEVITDQGRQFTSELFKTLATLCGVKLKHTTAYHPQSNGKIERFHRTLKAAIRAHNSNKWTESIPTVLLGLRAALRKDSDYSLTQMVYGKTIKLPGEFFDAPKISTTPETFLHKLQKQIESLKPKLTRHNTSPKIFVFKDLETCSHVFLKTCRVRKSLEPAYEGPFKVTSRTDKYFSIEIKGKEINVSIDRLKPAYILKEEEDIATTPGVAGDPRLAPPGADKEPSASAAPKMSRSGRTIRTPVRFRDKVECYPGFRSLKYTTPVWSHHTQSIAFFPKRLGLGFRFGNWPSRPHDFWRIGLLKWIDFSSEVTIRCKKGLLFMPSEQPFAGYQTPFLLPFAQLSVVAVNFLEHSVGFSGTFLPVEGEQQNFPQMGTFWLGNHHFPRAPEIFHDLNFSKTPRMLMPPRCRVSIDNKVELVDWRLKTALLDTANAESWTYVYTRGLPSEFCARANSLVISTSPRVESILESKDLINFLIEDPPGEETERQKWKIKDSQAKGIITCAMTDSQVSLILTCKTSKQIWASLTKGYEGDIKKKSIEARNNVSRLHMYPEESWKDYLHRSEKLLENARIMGATIDDEEFIYSVIKGLPQKYNIIAMQINTMNNPTLSDVKSQFLLYQERYHEKDISSSSAHKASQSESKKFYPKNKFKYKPECYICNKRGHKANDCWHNPKIKGNNNKREDLNKPSTSGYKPKFRNQQKQTGNSHNEKAANCLIAKNQEKSEQEWIIDSGATSHMTSCFELLKDSENKERKIILADDTQIESKAIGNVKIKTKEENLLILKDVLFVPQIKGNLLSVGKLLQDYQRIIFSKDKCTIIDFKDQVILEAPKIDDFYIINSSGSRDEEDKVFKVNWDIWHKRLGHPNENYMTIMKNKNLVYKFDCISKGDLNDCITCIKSKYSRKPTVSHLKVFGCKVEFWTPKHKRSKFEKITKTGMFVGYSSCRKAYRICNPENFTITETRDVSFLENQKGAELLTYKEQDSTDYSIIKIDGPAEEEETNSSSGDEESSVEIQNPASNTRYNFRHTHRPGFYYEPSLNEEEYEENSIIQAPNDTLLMTQYQNHIPKTYKEAIECPQASKWTEAMKKEINSLLEHHVWDIEPLPKGTKPIKSKWIFTIKNDPIIGKRYKARLVAAGYSQKYGIDYYQTFSPVISSDTLRILLCYAAMQNYDFKNYDIETAYLYGDLQEKQYMLQPEGFEMGDKNMVCKLKKAIYGLHLSAKVFYDTLKSHLLDEGFKNLTSDKCVFIYEKNNSKIILGIYVDNILAIYSDSNILNQAISKIENKFKLKENTKNTNLLGMEIYKENGKIFINQKAYIENILIKFEMENCKTKSTPLDVNIDFSQYENSKKCDPKKYQEILGNLLFLSVKTRPDLSFPLTQLSKYSQDPREIHFGALKGIFGYLKKTINFALCYKKGNTQLTGFSDASWKDGKLKNKTVTGYLFTVGDNLISWNSKFQAQPSLSTCDSELQSLLSCCKKSIHLQYIIEELFQLENGYQPTKIYCDNISAIKLCTNFNISANSAHMIRAISYLHEQIISNNFILEYIQSENNLSDF